MSLYGDKLTFGSGSQQDSLALGSGASADNYRVFDPVELVTNSFDWEDGNVDGLADNWDRVNINSTPSIISNSLGFSGRAQKIACLIGDPDIYQRYPNYENNKWMRLKLKCYNASAAADLRIMVGSTIVTRITQRNELVEIDMIFFTTASFIFFDFYFVLQNASSGEYFVIDEVSLKLLQADNLELN